MLDTDSKTKISTETHGVSRSLFRSRFLWKLYVGYCLLILITAGAVGFMVALRIERESLADKDLRLRSEALLLRDIAAEYLRVDSAEPASPLSATAPGLSSLQQRITVLGQQTGSHLTVITVDGNVLADSHRDPRSMGDQGRTPEVQLAQDDPSGQGKVSRYSPTREERMRYLALRVEPDDVPLGYVRTSLPLTTLGERLANLRAIVLVAVAIATFFALILGLLHARRVSRPLLSIAAAAAAIADGDYDKRVESDSSDELGVLARSFNRMRLELRHSLASLDADRTKLKAILASMEEGVVALDRDERVVHMNQVAGRLLHIDPESALERPIWELTRLHELSEALGETLELGEPVHRVIRRPGPDRILDVHASPLTSGGDVPDGAVLVIDDITQLRRLETLRRDFFGNVSHELKTPVAAIHGLVATLVDDPSIETATRQRFLVKVLNQTERLSSLVSDLLSLSRLESGGDLELEPIDVCDVVRDSLRLLRPLAEDRDIHLEALMPDETAMIDGEEETLRQAVSNLLNNAIKYTPKGGSVVVEVFTDADTIRLQVRDTGLGIERRHLERIFERFYRVDKARSREVGGTGLGLAIVKHAARAMRGDVSVRSTTGKGSTFEIQLPRSPAA